jgi:predicted ATPase
VVVLGEPGIGKSALLTEASAIAARAGLVALAGRAAEHERTVPYALIVDALDDHVASMGPARLRVAGPELAAVLPSARGPESSAPWGPSAPSDRFTYHRAVGRLLELLARERAFVLVLDDLQWADEASLQLLVDVLRRPPGSAHALLLAGRESEAV